MSDLKSRILDASKWSLITEVVSKLAAPIINMVLARVLTPEAFGVIATITMITSFADLFSDAGFQKYLVQHEFENERHLNEQTNVAFYTNLFISTILWVLIFVFKDHIAKSVGNPGLGLPLSIASLVLFLTSFSSIQTARFRRALDFKTLFYSRLIGIIVPFVVTIPFALVLKSFWAMIIGNITVQIANAIMLTIRSDWKPSFYYSISDFKEMFGFSMWTLTEQLLGWANLNVGIFFVGLYLTSYELGLYKTSMATVNQVMSIIVNSVSPVLLSALSRVVDNKNEYKRLFYDFEEKVAVVIIPLGIGIFVYRDLITKILLGSQWEEATSFIGLWSLMRALLIVFGIFSMEVFVSLGKPKISVLSQVLCLMVLFPVLLHFAPLGYNQVFVARSLVVVWSIFVDLVLLQIFAGISVVAIARRSAIYFGFSIIVGGIGALSVHYIDNAFIQFATAILCMLVYIGLLYLVPKTRNEVKDLVKMFSRNNEVA